jgi:hypothetical protein
MLDDFELQDKKIHLRYIELDESAIGNEILFKIYNNDNNYSNGFMTKWAQIKIHNVVLLPKALFSVDVMKLIKNRFKEKAARIAGKAWTNPEYGDDESRNFQFATSNFSTNKKKDDRKMFWPGCRYVSIESKGLHGELPSYSNQWTGESCKIIMKVIKKHNLLFFVPPKTKQIKGYIRIASLIGITPYINIYNENKRSHNA